MKYTWVFLMIIILLSCSSKEEELKKLDIFNNTEISSFINHFLENQNKKDKENVFLATERTKFLGNKLKKSTVLLDRNNWIITNKEFDSLISKEDWDYIKLQVNDKKDYFIQQRDFKQKLLNSDSLKKENIKFSDNQGRIIDSLRKSNLEKAKTYISETAFIEHHNFIKKFTPILHFDKPVFLKDNKRIIFTYYTYSGMLSAYSETALYEFKYNKWYKVKIIRWHIS